MTKTAKFPPVSVAKAAERSYQRWTATAVMDVLEMCIIAQCVRSERLKGVFLDGWYTRRENEERRDTPDNIAEAWARFACDHPALFLEESYGLSTTQETLDKIVRMIYFAGYNSPKHTEELKPSSCACCVEQSA